MEKKLGLSALTALVLSSMLGAGVFSLPQNMAAVASPSALLIGWGITGVGILFLAFAMLLLTRIRPDLDGGIFTYAREGFGELIGFCSAWGYWLCAVVANVSYLVIVFSALSFFTDTPETAPVRRWQYLAIHRRRLGPAVDCPFPGSARRSNGGRYQPGRDAGQAAASRGVYRAGRYGVSYGDISPRF
ncbi:Arginine/ornithine antiporter ArcD [Klebsiella grimontii]|uniref:Arginine/ornithine antiporter ArcD n=1 Tax=Klebsiella grimontii TaxID=2058152 RepID=A0A7H4P2T3_9ENTR|nr:Arginine/ornithine antiporter ArcD [Klebsiella grimontii]